MTAAMFLIGLGIGFFAGVLFFGLVLVRIAKCGAERGKLTIIGGNGIEYIDYGAPKASNMSEMVLTALEDAWLCDDSVDCWQQVYH